jgi:outer membrane protein TolC
LNLDRGINPITLPNGATEFIRQNQNESTVGLNLSQPLPWTGSVITVGSQLSRIDLFGDQPISFWQTTPFVIGLQQDLFRPRALLWDRRQQEVNASLAERQYFEARADVASMTAAAFFDLYAAEVALANATTNAAVNDTLYTLNKGRYEVGKIGENDLLQSELALLRARTSRDGARLDRDRAEATLRRLVGLPPGKPVATVPPTLVPTIEVDPAVAVTEALRNASRMDQIRLDSLQALRRLSEARLNNGFGATIQAMLGFNQTASGFAQAYQTPLAKQRLVVGVAMPIFQWGGGHADIQAARAEESRVASTAQAAREALEEDARFSALQLTQSQRILDISAKADTVASKRFEVAKNRYVIGKIGIGDLYIAQTEKDAAVLAYAQALRAYWTAYYRLRRVTLFDFAEKREITDR